MFTKKSFLGITAAILVFTGFVAAVSAQDIGAPVEAINDFRVLIEVNLDNSVEVTETITYDTGPLERHGIYRDIYPYSSQGRLMSIGDIAVTLPQGQAEPWKEMSEGEYVRIRTGDPDVTFNGERTYVIKYRASDAIAHIEDVDDIYWNVTGNRWDIPIRNVSVDVILPDDLKPIRSACYHGPSGSTARCDDGAATTTFKSAGSLDPGEGLTVAVGFPKGIVADYSKSDNLMDTLRRNLGWIISLLVPILVFILMYRRWSRKGRDPKGRGVIIPQYDVPDKLTPFEVSCIVSEKVGNADFSAEIVYLATQGYLKIEQLEEKILGIFKSTDYRFTLLKDPGLLPDEFDRNLLRRVFSDKGTPGETTKLSTLKNKFYEHIPEIIGGVVDAVKVKGYYSNLGTFALGGKGSAYFIIFSIIWATLFFGSMGSVIFRSGPLPFMLGIFLSISIIIFFWRLMPAKTERGVAAKEHILGLKDYLSIAEKDRLHFHNAPEKKPEIFEKFLPYAMVLGVSGVWAKEFEDIYMTPPNWYHGTNPGAFNAVAFNDSLSSFGAATASSMSSSPGGGSGGGGSSGGGGGGGGGGGW